MDRTQKRGYKEYKGTTLKIDSLEVIVKDKELALYSVGDTVVVEQKIAFINTEPTALAKATYSFMRKDSKTREIDSLVPNSRFSDQYISRERLAIIIKQAKDDFY